MLKPILYSSIFILASMLCSAQDIEPKWLKYFGGQGSDEIYSSAMDNAGNLYITGYFQDEITFDNCTLKSLGSSDIFLAKFDSDGRLLWAKQAGGTYSENLIIAEFAKKIKIDNQGNIIIAGCFMWQAFFDSTSLRGRGYMDIFVSKYDASGKVIWVKAYGGNEHDFFYDMDVLDDQIFITGILTGLELQKPTSQPTISENSNLSSSSTFIAGLDRNGEILWWKRDTLQAQKTLIKAFDNMLYYARGYYLKKPTLDNTYNMNAANFSIQKISAMGTIDWEKNYISDTNKEIEAFDVMSDGALIMIGKQMPEKNITITSPTNYLKTNSFFCKIDSKSDLTLTEFNNQNTNETSSSLKTSQPSESLMQNQTFSLSYDSDVSIKDGFRTKLQFDKANLLTTNNYLPNKTNKIKSAIQLNEKDALITGNCISKLNQHSNRNSDRTSLNIFIGRCKISEFSNISEDPKSGDIEANIFISPNPAIDYCDVYSENYSKVDNLEVINTEGKIIQTHNQFKLPGKIYFNGLSSDTYLIKLSIGNTTIHKKLIISKD